MEIIKGSFPLSVVYVYDIDNNAEAVVPGSKYLDKIEETETVKKILCDNDSMYNVVIKECLGNDNYVVTLSATGDDKVFNMNVQFECDRFLNDVIKDGIKAGGKLHGSFVWCCVDGKMKLVLENSDTHKRIYGYIKRKNKKPVPTSSLIVGGIYEDRQENKFIYLGAVDTDQYEYNIKVKRRHNHADIRNYVFKKRKLENAILFAQIGNNLKVENMQEHIDKYDKEVHCPLKFRIQTSHSFIHHIHTVKVDPDFIEKLRDIQIKEMVFGASHYSKKYSYITNYEEKKLAYYCRFSSLVHMNKAGFGSFPPTVGEYHEVDMRIEK